MCSRAELSEVVHDHSGIAIYLEGEARVRMGVHYALRRGDVLLVPEGMPHGSSATERPNDAEIVGISLCTACLRSPWGTSLREMLDDVRRGAIAARRLTDDELATAVALTTRVDDELRERRPHHALMVDGLMTQLTALLARASVVDVRVGDAAWPAAVADALSFVERHAHEGISLREVARAVGRSPTHLATLVKRHTGRTVVAWITHARMALARQLLVSSDEGVESIAGRVGFASPSHFHRAFRRAHEASPGEWRSVHRAR